MSTAKSTRIQFIKYHEAADQQPLSKKAAEKLGIFPSIPLLQLAAWVRSNGFGNVEYLDLHARNLLPEEANAVVRDFDGRGRADRQDSGVARGHRDRAHGS